MTISHSLEHFVGREVQDFVLGKALAKGVMWRSAPSLRPAILALI
jgi:hypothetical protein